MQTQEAITTGFGLLNPSQLDDFADLIARKINPITTLKSITFGELFELYFERHVKVRNRNWQNAHYFYKIHGPRWRDVSVHEITRRDLQAWADELALRSKSAATRAVNMMSAIINWGLKRDLLPPIKNPCIGVEKFVVPSRRRFLRPDEFVRLKLALDQEKPIMRHFFWMCLLTGARRGNVLSMRWDEIDFTLATWTIPEAKFKNGDEHIVPLSNSAIDILKARRDAVDSPWVFPGFAPDNHLVEPKTAWSRVLERAGIANLRIHDLRRTLASYMAMKGESTFVIGQMLGHRDVRSTAVYARLNLQVVRAAAESVNEKWNKLLKLPIVAAVETQQKKISQQQTVVPKNAQVSLQTGEQIIVEAKILTVLRAGGSTKKHFYRKIGSQIQINSLELDRVLIEMQERMLIQSYQDDKGVWRYALIDTQKQAQAL